MSTAELERRRLFARTFDEQRRENSQRAAPPPPRPVAKATVALETATSIWKTEQECCVVCKYSQIDTLLNPCGHYKYCEPCAKENLATDIENHRICALCRTRVVSAIKVFR